MLKGYIVDADWLEDGDISLAYPLSPAALVLPWKKGPCVKFTLGKAWPEFGYLKPVDQNRFLVPLRGREREKRSTPLYK